MMSLTKHCDSSLVKLNAMSRFSLGQEKRGEISSISETGEKAGCQRRVDKQPYISSTNGVAEVDSWATQKKKNLTNIDHVDGRKLSWRMTPGEFLDKPCRNTFSHMLVGVWVVEVKVKTATFLDQGNSQYQLHLEALGRYIVKNLTSFMEQLKLPAEVMKR